MRKTSLSTVLFDKNTINKGLITALSIHDIYYDGQWRPVTSVEEIHNAEIAIQLIAALENAQIMQNLRKVGVPIYYLLQHIFEGLAKIQKIEILGNSITIVTELGVRFFYILDNRALQKIYAENKTQYWMLIVPREGILQQ